MVPGTEQTVGEWLIGMAESDQSSELDSAKMVNLLRKVGFTKAVVTYGIVYLEGKGTLDAPPTSIHSIAQMLVNKDGKRLRHTRNRL